jgi:hypothetical protein
MEVIKNPKNNADKRSKKRLLEAINSLINNRVFNRADMEEAFSKKILVVKPSIETLEKILDDFAIISYNKQTKTYRVKKKR